MQACVSLVTLGTRDLERAVRFYRDGLGFPLSSESVEGEVAFFRTAGTVLAIWHRHKLVADGRITDSGSAFGGIALAHNVAEKHQVDEALAAAAAAGATLLKPGSDTEYGGYAGYF